MALSCRVSSSSSRSSLVLRRSPDIPFTQRAAIGNVAPKRHVGSTRSHQLPAARVLDVNSSTFEAEVLKSDKTVLVDFWASWCGPCKLILPLMIWAEKEYEGSLKVVKVEVDANKSLVEKYKVYGLPAFILFRNGEPVEDSKREGAISKNVLAQYLASNGVAATVSK